MASVKYNFVENNKANLTGFKISEGKFKDVIYYYGKVKFIEEDEKLRLKFDYNVARNPDNVDTDGEEFRQVIGDILAENIEREIDDGTIGKNRKNSPS